jgi:release factor glutamine methyltransferase
MMLASQVDFWPFNMSLINRIRESVVISFMRLAEARREYECTIAGKNLVVFPKIGYQTNILGLHRMNFQYTEFMGRNLLVRPGDIVLEIGTGCGLIALIAGDIAEHVIATDINPKAIDCARMNMLRNGANNIDTRVGDLFSPLGDERFDLIVWNMPFYFDKAVKDIESSNGFHTTGQDMIKRFIKEVPDYLKKGGKVQFALSRIEDRSHILATEFDRVGFNMRPVSSFWGFGRIEGSVVYVAESR